MRLAQSKYGQFEGWCRGLDSGNHKVVIGYYDDDYAHVQEEVLCFNIPVMFIAYIQP